jgi:hypothetical protein
MSLWLLLLESSGIRLSASILYEFIVSDSPFVRDCSSPIPQKSETCHIHIRLPVSNERPESRFGEVYSISVHIALIIIHTMDPDIKLGDDDAYPTAMATVLTDAVAPGFTSPRIAYVPRTSAELDSDQLRTLQDQGFPLGLARQLGQSCVRYPRRFWIVDNSGSMRTTDVRSVIYYIFCLL